MTDELRPSIFRDVNERIAEITGSWNWDDKQGFLCECAAGSCTKAIWLTRAQYEEIRAEPARFFAVPGHERGADGQVVERHAEYIVVEQGGEEGKDARLRAEAEPESQDQTGVTDLRQERLILNEKRLRRANVLVDAGRDAELRGRKELFLCECSNDDCAATLELHWDGYRAIRAHEARYVIRPGHETAGIDSVIEEHDGYVIVQKLPRRR